MATLYKATVRYDGTNFCGWQVQPKGPTVQGALEEALGKIAGEAVSIIGAGRTDAGAHALGQVFSFRWKEGADAERLRRSVSQMVGPDIRVVDMVEAGEDFHARYSAVSKRYAYSFSQTREPDPFSSRYAWSIPMDVGKDRVFELAQGLVGEHDFAGFQASRSSVQDTVRTIYSVEEKAGGVVDVADDSALWRLEFHGTGFLYKMVRNIVGTIIDIARRATPESRIKELLESPGPFRGYTAPSHGLALLEVFYD